MMAAAACSLSDIVTTGHLLVMVRSTVPSSALYSSLDSSILTYTFPPASAFFPAPSSPLPSLTTLSVVFSVASPSCAAFFLISSAAASSSAAFPSFSPAAASSSAVFPSFSPAIASSTEDSLSPSVPPASFPFGIPQAANVSRAKTSAVTSNTFLLIAQPFLSFSLFLLLFFFLLLFPIPFFLYFFSSIPPPVPVRYKPCFILLFLIKIWMSKKSVRRFNYLN